MATEINGSAQVVLQAFADVIQARFGELEDRVARAEATANAALRRGNAAAGGGMALTISGRDIPAPVVHNQVDVPATDVNVVNNVEPTPINVTAPALDLAPLADVFDRHLAAAHLFNAQLVEELREKNALLSQLVQTLAAQEPPTVKVPAPRVDVAAPSVTVQAPPARKRELKISFDGDEATVKEV